MKKKLSIGLSVVLCLVFCVTMLSACNNKGIKAWEKNEIVQADSPLYRDYYHIFVYSFYDSDGDGIGDLKGIERKLDYIAGLGFNGIWLSPIHPCSTEHGYDVQDYYGVDKRFGTLDIFDELVQAAHDRGISVMMDLVINHSSNKHPWFLASQQAWQRKDTSNKYYDYYTFTNETGTDYATFESEKTMPKLNLNSQGVRNEIDGMCKFWLQDHNVDAFRLDAAWHFYYKDANKNVAFMQWLMNTARKYNPDVYMVGEVWANSATVFNHYAENSVQSFFNFDFGTPSNKLMQTLNSGQNNRATQITELITAKEKGTSKGIDALFASNHDTTRVSNAISYINARTGEVTDERMSQYRMSIALLYTQTGNVFNYYGNEIGMRNSGRQSSSSDYKDYTYRTAMYWSVDSTFDYSDGFAFKAYGYSGRFGEYDDYLGGVAEQIDDQNSLLNFYRRVMLLRRQNPEIAQGTSTFISQDDPDLLVLVREYKGSKILMVYNLHAEDKVQLDLSPLISQYGLKGTLAGFLSGNNERDVTVKGNTITLPQYSMAVIR